MSQEQAFDDGVAAVGNLTALAAALDETIQTLSNWRVRGVPANKCKRFEAITGVSVRRLRPTDWHEYWPDAKADRPRASKHAAAS